MSATATVPKASLFLNACTPGQRAVALDDFVTTTRQIEQRLDDVPASRLREDFLRIREESRQEDLAPMIGNFVCAAAYAAQAIRRTLGFRLHDVQIRGALAAASGSIIEMQTGEGKTVVCGLTALIRSIFDRSVHVATTNDYLAQRDHDSVQAVFRLLGTSSAVIRSGSAPSSSWEISRGSRVRSPRCSWTPPGRRSWASRSDLSCVFYGI